MANKINKITILGSTGSIGVQTLDVLRSLPSVFKINALTANKNIDVLEQQAMEFNPASVVISDYDSYKQFKTITKYKGNILYGREGLFEVASDSSNDLLVSSLVGFSGVEPTLAAINKGINVALANKETLVSAGHIITKAAKKSGSEIIAIDSEHNAILQCLAGETKEEIEKLILTASGGPFLNTPGDKFKNLTVREALNHPNWSMGDKISIDSATMMNKGLEVIEAHWLFDIPMDKIDVVIHPQSIIHSMVQFIDGSVKAQLGLPDMRIPISYALTKPKRFSYDFPRLDLTEIGTLEFFKPDLEKFKCLNLAYQVIKIGGAAPAILNAANEVSVDAFLKEKIIFTDIPHCIVNALEKIEVTNHPDIEDIIELDEKTRVITNNFISNINK